MDRIALEYTSHYACGGGKDDKGHAYPNEPPIICLDGDTEVKVEDGYLRYRYTDVI